MKPREWWIYVDKDLIGKKNESNFAQFKTAPIVAWNPNIEGYVNVIEKSALMDMALALEMIADCEDLNEEGRRFIARKALGRPSKKREGF